MNRTRALTALLLPWILAGVLHAQDLSQGEPVPGVVLVRFTPDALPEIAPRLLLADLQAGTLEAEAAHSLLQQVGFVEGRKVFENFYPADTLATHRRTGEPVTLMDLSRWYLLKVDAGADIRTLAQRLAALPGIEAAVPEYAFGPSVLPNDSDFQQGTRQWGLRNTAFPGRDIHAPGAWDLNRGRSDVVVAIVDGGIDYNHADLDPGNRSRIIQGYDTADGDADPMDDIPFGYGFANHGTRIAGIVGAITDNSSGVAGVMWNVQIMPVKVAYTNGPWWDPFFTGPGTAYSTNIGQGIEYARAYGADIINLSLGRPASEAPGTFEQWFIGNPMVQAIVNAYRQGLLVFAASGNDSQNEVGYPAFHPLAIAVGNSTITDARNPSSNYGNALDFVAPGSGYYSTFRGGSTAYAGSGTSFASPMAAAVGGLVLSESRDLGLNLTNDDIRQILRRSADDLGPAGFDVEYGYGRINAEAALEMINPPNTVAHFTRSSGSSTMTWGSHTHTFLNGAYGAGGSLASGTYYGVKQYKVSGYVAFSGSYQQAPEVWVRERETTGWTGANPNNQSPYVKITNVTASGFNWETFVYWIGSNALGQQINAYYPAAPSNLSLAFTAVGEPQPPLTASVSGPSPLAWKQNGTYTASYSGGSGAVSYAWWLRPTGGVWQPTGVTGSTYSFLMVYTNGVDVRVDVTRGSQTASATKHVAYCSSPCLGEVQAEGSDDIRIELGVPTVFAVHAPRPNPARGPVEVPYDLPASAEVTATVYDVVGRQVLRVHEGLREAGEHQLVLDPSGLPNGTYVIRVVAGSESASHRMVVAR